MKRKYFPSVTTLIHIIPLNPRTIFPAQLGTLSSTGLSGGCSPMPLLLDNNLIQALKIRFHATPAFGVFVIMDELGIPPIEILDSPPSQRVREYKFRGIHNALYL